MVGFKHVKENNHSGLCYSRAAATDRYSQRREKKANTFCQKPIKLSCTFSVFLIPSVLINMIFLSKHKLSSLQLSFPLSPTLPPRQNTARDDTIPANSGN